MVLYLNEFINDEMARDSGHDTGHDTESDSDPATADLVGSSGESAESRASGKAWREKLQALATTVAEREGCEIYDIEMIGGGGNRILRIFIDKVTTGTDATDTDATAGKGVSNGVSKGVSIGDCANVSHALNLLLDVEDPIPGGAYHLEVSSPGLERPLRTLAHYQRAKGSRVQIKTFESLIDLDSSLDEEARKRFGKSKQVEGVLVGVVTENGETRLSLDAETGGRVICVSLPLAKVTKAHTVFIFESNEKPTGGGKKKK